MSKLFVQSILIISLLAVPAFGADGDDLFYSRGTGEMGWICPVLAESTGYVYLGFAYEREEYWHTGSSVMCFDRDGGEVWTFPISNKDQPCGGFTLNAAEDRLYFGTYERGGDMYCLNALTGAVIWQSSTALGWPNNTRRFGASPALSADETVLYCGSGGEVWNSLVDQRFYACNATTGQLLWMYEASHDDRQERPDLQALPESETAGCGFWPDPAVGPDGTIYAGNFNGILYAFNPDGTIKWQYETYWYDESAPPGEERRVSSFSIWHEIWGAPALNSDASVVYIASNDWFVHAIDTATGQMLWKYECCFNCEATTGTAEIYTNPAVGADGSIYVHSEDNYSYAFNANGTLKWRSSAVWDALTGTDELADDEGQELCFLGSFTLLADGTLIAGVDTARHYAAINASDGSLKWLTKLNIDWAEGDDTDEIHTEPVVDPVTNRVYGGTGWLGGLVAFEESSSLAYAAPWPRSQRDNRSSGYFVATGPDTTPPDPDPMTWAVVPAPDGCSAITMTATTATDPSGVNYFFDETSANPGGSDSGWQPGTSYSDDGLNQLTQYCYQVKARDLSANQNETAWSTVECAGTATQEDCHVEALVCSEQSCGPPNKNGVATVTIYDNCGVPIVGADVTGTFTGDFNETLTETTNGNGQAVIITVGCVKKPTFQFCVDDVAASIPYDPTDNVVTCCND